MTKCPICKDEYFNVKNHDDVCENHLDNWMVTVCVNCHRVSFSTARGICLECLTKTELIPASILKFSGVMKQYGF